ncbi:MAG: hypothetical protein HQK88_13750, partial [Nitrospirae bacterium]|nr:hypothetical protein [Nitrospirota bacterium]MBF0536497.1 hypothetical protein [Nitrospirota bacterium]MBF0617865.1 hypothetical protein [Nitrospirota bacterium]
MMAKTRLFFNILSATIGLTILYSGNLYAQSTGDLSNYIRMLSEKKSTSEELVKLLKELPPEIGTNNQTLIQYLEAKSAVDGCIDQIKFDLSLKNNINNSKKYEIALNAALDNAKAFSDNATMLIETNSHLRPLQKYYNTKVEFKNITKCYRKRMRLPHPLRGFAMTAWAVR